MATKSRSKSSRANKTTSLVTIDPEKERPLAFATEVLGDRPTAERWMESPIIALGGVTPSSFLEKKGGAAEVEAVLGRIAYGGYS